MKQTNEIDTDTLIAQGDRELQKAENAFLDVQSFLDKAIAIQWLIDQSKNEIRLPIIEAIIDMTEHLNAYRVDFEGLKQITFFEQAQNEFCTEIIDEFIDGKASSK